MIWAYWVSGIITVLLMIYLIVAVLLAEKFFVVRFRRRNYMSIIYWIGGIVALFLLVYLLMALLKPEIFS